MADTTISFTDAQLQKILATIEATKSGSIHWEQVLPVFLSALLAMCVGIGLEGPVANFKTGHNESGLTVTFRLC